jgi:hypothetical protein
MLKWLLIAAGLLVSARVQAQTPANPPPLTTFSGNIVVGAATSTSLIAANVTLDPNSGALPKPGNFSRLVIIPPASCVVNICWFGGTCSATAGEPMGSGTNVGTDTVNVATTPLGGTPAAPTLYSTAGCTVYFRN